MGVYDQIYFVLPVVQKLFLALIDVNLLNYACLNVNSVRT